MSNTLNFKPAPELTHPSKNYPADYTYSYDVAEYKGITIKRCYVNGQLSSVWPYRVVTSNWEQTYQTQRACIVAINKHLSR